MYKVGKFLSKIKTTRDKFYRLKFTLFKQTYLHFIKKVNLASKIDYETLSHIFKIWHQIFTVIKVRKK